MSLADIHTQVTYNVTALFHMDSKTGLQNPTFLEAGDIEIFQPECFTKIFRWQMISFNAILIGEIKYNHYIPNHIFLHHFYYFSSFLLRRFFLTFS